MSFIARYVYTYKEFVFVTEATARSATEWQWQNKNTDNKKKNLKEQVMNNIQIDNCVYRYITMDNSLIFY